MFCVKFLFKVILKSINASGKRNEMLLIIYY